MFVCFCNENDHFFYNRKCLVILSLKRSFSSLLKMCIYFSIKKCSFVLPQELYEKQLQMERKIITKLRKKEKKHRAAVNAEGELDAQISEEVILNWVIDWWSRQGRSRSTNIRRGNTFDMRLRLKDLTELAVEFWASQLGPRSPSYPLIYPPALHFQATIAVKRRCYIQLINLNTIGWYSCTQLIDTVDWTKYS